MEATNAVKSSSCILIIGYKFQNPGNVISTYGLLSDLGLDQWKHPWTDWLICSEGPIATSHSKAITCVQLHSQLQNNNTFTFEEACTEGIHPQIKDMHHFLSNEQFRSIKHHLDLLTLILLDSNINPENYEHSIIWWFNSPYIYHQSLHHGSHSLLAIC